MCVSGNMKTTAGTNKSDENSLHENSENSRQKCTKKKLVNS